MKYGWFDDQNFEYVINRPDTPLPWINYLGMEEYFGIISNTAGGYSFYKDSRLRRITRYRYNNAPLDVGGRYIYLRDNNAVKPTFWSPTWQPTRTPLDGYECRHGMGYTRIKSEFSGIHSESKYFVPLGENLEIWEFEITNHRKEKADLSIFSGIEFCLWDAVDDSDNFQRNYSIGEVEVEEGVIYHKSEYRERRNHFAFFACSEPLAGFDTQREAFLGAYRGWETPLVVESGNSTQSLTVGWQPIGSHHIKFTLQPGESRKVIYLLGYQENPIGEKFAPEGTHTINKTGVKPVLKKYLQPAEVEKSFTELQAYWAELLDKLQVTTPDLHTNRMVNIWNAYQMMITFNFSRSASYFESGIGRGMGFRDSNQDLLGFMHLVPERARERIIDLASTQLPTGGAYHQYQPMTKLGNNDIGGNFNDDPQWLVLSVSSYIRETGDWSILDAPVPFDNQPGSEEPLYNHLQRSIKYTADRLGPHGLPLIGRADWNDCLNLNCFSDTPGQSFQTTTGKDGTVAESVFIAGLFTLALDEMIALAGHLKKTDEEKQYQALQTKMKAAVDTAGWDGDWFRRAYDNFGNPVGSRECDKGQIFIEPQGMCIMAGIGLNDGRAQKALDSVANRLAFEHGIVLLQPAYDHYLLNIGEISSYPPGYKENGSVFCHTNPWIMIAETRIGRGNEAFDYYLRINPSVREEISEIHRCEPYVYSQMISGAEALVKGEAKNSWLTGSAAWNYIAITQYILGIRPTLDGLQVAPMIPTSWQEFEATRKYRGVNYQIKVQRKGPGNNAALIVDGQPIDGTIIPLPKDYPKKVEVLVILGNH